MQKKGNFAILLDNLARPHGFLIALFVHRTLISQLANREIRARYKGATLGGIWALINPLIMMAVYTFVFSAVFRTRWHDEQNPYQFALYLYCGLIVFGIFSECLNRAPALMFENTAYVKKVIFPLEIMGWTAMASALFNATTNLVVMLIAQTFIFGSPPWTVLLLPFVVLPAILGTLGLTWFLASLGVFIRDTRQIVGALTNFILFLSPIFYPASAIPASFRWLMVFNPLAPVLEATRAVVFAGTAPSASYFILGNLLGVAVAWLGFTWFQATRKAFADVI